MTRCLIRHLCAIPPPQPEQSRTERAQTATLPIKADKVPAGSDWLHEVKYDGHRMMLIREQGRIRGGHD